MDSDQPSEEASQPDEQRQTEVKDNHKEVSESNTTQSQNQIGANENMSSGNVTEAGQADAGHTAPLRENMISTAVKFLQNPQVQSSSLSQRRAFLKKKGLTDDEIRSAIERSGVKEPTTVPSVQQGQQPPGLNQTTAVVPVLPPPPPPPRTIYSRGREYAAVAIIISGVTYGLYKLFQKFIRPFFKKQGESEKRLQSIETSLIEVNHTLTVTVQEIQKSVSLIQTSLEKQEARLEQISRDVIASKALSSVRGGDGDVTQIKQEITSLKGLMLNRHQFPSTPQQSSIPDWQKESSTPSQEMQPQENGKDGSSEKDESIKKDLVADSQYDGNTEDVEMTDGTNGNLSVDGGVDRGVAVNLLKKSMLENSFSQAEKANEQTAEATGGQVEGKEEVD